MSTASRWRYRAADASGAEQAGEIDAASERDAVDVLRRRALWVTQIEPANASGAGAPAMQGDAGSAALDSGSSAPRLRGIARSLADTLTGRSVQQELAVVVRAMSTLLAAGVPLDRVLGYAGGPALRPELQTTFADVRTAVRGGSSLSEAIGRAPLFPALFAPTIAAGEASGTLPLALAGMADHLDRGEALRNRLRAALTYPALLGVASIAAIVVILLVVVPRFATLIAESGGTLPVSTRALIRISGIVTSSWWLVLMVAGVAVAAFRRWLVRGEHRAAWDAQRLRWPVLGFVERTRAAAAYTSVLATALRAGLPLLSAMRLARGVVGNRAIAASLSEAEERVRSGGRVAAALEGVLPPLAVRLLDAGESGADLAGMATRAADAADAELQRAASTAVALVEPALILLFGGIVGFVALALLQAIYGLNARTL